MPLRILDEKVIAGISAGEVIERPASVVKELVENALDAGATRIQVEIERGGIGEIRVVDNGSGIPASDAIAAFSRHATSKLSSLDDLNRIASFGFRGEALAAIQAAADVDMLTRERASNEGVRVQGSAGGPLRARPAGCDAGTSISVRNIFRKMPARLKFLKSVGAESSAIARILESYGLAEPRVHFFLKVDGEERANYPQAADLYARVLEVLGGPAKEMLSLEGSQEPLRVYGFAQAPGTVRRRGRFWLLVNRRPVEDKAMRHALISAYQGMMPSEASPNAVIHLEIPPSRLDVNVHPAKAEVRFQDQQAIYRLLLDSLKDSFGKEQPGPPPAERSFAATAGDGQGGSGAAVAYPGLLLGVPGGGENTGTRPAAEIHSARNPESVAQTEDLRILGQLFRTYIVAQDRQGLMILDQHAAHERIIYDRLLRRQHNATQALLIPETIELTPSEALLLESHRETLFSLGFELDGFGGRSAVLRAVPEESANLQGLIRRILDELAEAGRAPESEELIRRARSTMACHMAVQAGKTLGQGEMEALVRELLILQDFRTCPHGRPTVIGLTERDLARRFQRS